MSVQQEINKAKGAEGLTNIGLAPHDLRWVKGKSVLKMAYSHTHLNIMHVVLDGKGKYINIAEATLIRLSAMAEGYHLPALTYLTVSPVTNALRQSGMPLTGTQAARLLAYQVKIAEMVVFQYYPCAACDNPVEMERFSCPHCGTYNPDHAPDPNNPDDGEYLTVIERFERMLNKEP